MMCGVDGALHQSTHAEALAALAWLVEAGMDTLVEDRPYAWLAPPVPEQIPPPPVAEPITPCEADAVIEARNSVVSVDSLSALQAALADFDGCSLATHGAKPLFSGGVAGSALMIVGDMPTAEDVGEDMIFSGRAGLLLDRMLAAIGLSRGTVYLANTVYWATPGGRTPAAAEIAACLPFLTRQIELAQPRVVLALGGTATAALTGTGTTKTPRASSGIARLRGKWQGGVVPVLPSFHPSQLLAQPGMKALAWRDLLTLKARLTDA
jgi:uracil-DNA glycosylase family 4